MSRRDICSPLKWQKIKNAGVAGDIEGDEKLANHVLGG